VIDLITTALPVTLTLNLIAFPIIYLIAVPFGMLAAVKKGGWQDTVLGGVFVAFWSIPTVWAGVMCLGYLCSSQYLRLFPTGGIGNKDNADMLFLPVIGVDGFERGFVLDALWHVALPVFWRLCDPEQADARGDARELLGRLCANGEGQGRCGPGRDLPACLPQLAAAADHDVCDDLSRDARGQRGHRADLQRAGDGEPRH